MQSQTGSNQRRNSQRVETLILSRFGYLSTASEVPLFLCFGGQQQGDGAEVSCIAKYFTLKFDFEESSEE